MERLGSLDAIFLEIESPTTPMNIGSVSIFEGAAPSFAEIRAFVAARVALVPRCRQRVRRSGLGLTRPVWIDDVGFDLGRHLHHVTLPAGGIATLESVVVEAMTTPLDRRAALWEMWLVEGLADGRWAVISKVHHCMVDGIAGTDLLAVMLDADVSVPPGPPPTWRPTPEPSALAVACFGLARTARSIRAHLGGIVRALGRPGRSWQRLRDLLAGARGLWLQPRRRDSPLTGPIGPDRRWAHLEVSLADVGVARDRFGGTVNDVVLSAIALGFRELLTARGEPVEGRDVMALVPVSLRTRDARGQLDNRVAVTHALLPVGISEPAAAYTAVRQHLDALKRSHQADASAALLHTGDYAPHVVAGAVARGVVRMQRNIETIATNVPGPRAPLFVCGRRMIEAYPFAPIGAEIRIAIAIWSYCGTFYFGITVDREAVTDLDTLVVGIRRAFAALRTAAETDGPSGLECDRVREAGEDDTPEPGHQHEQEDAAHAGLEPDAGEEPQGDHGDR